MYTGERILPNQIYRVTHQQSLLAYQFASTYAAGKTVLDVACGEGYGTCLLATKANHATGLDYNANAVTQARLRYQQPNLTFVVGDLFSASTALPGESFDVVTCFQTIEHVADHDHFIESLKTITKPGGQIIISTPNRNVFPSFNPYHVHEVGEQELQDLCRRHFSSYTVYGVQGDESVWQYRQTKQKVSDAILRLDFLHTRDFLPKPVVKFIYGFVSRDIIKRLSFLKHKQTVSDITLDNFTISHQNISRALDFIVVAAA